ncbi:unnamed protein product [Nezara viridula]|uniref:Uncharacterized protein n=1 Tax=Nezara viridula TaxID=85310 RepID=A0A9P0HTI5_NEZVI|nr:unnamed protein product [Nezara viridula]
MPTRLPKLNWKFHDCPCPRRANHLCSSDMGLVAITYSGCSFVAVPVFRGRGGAPTMRPMIHPSRRTTARCRGPVYFQSTHQFVR